MNEQTPSSSNASTNHPPRLALVICAVLEWEIERLAEAMPHVVHIDKLEQGLHNEPDKLRVEVQAAIERCEQNERVEAVALGYGLCSRGTEGVAARRCRLVVPRAHDCITLLLGSKQRYEQYVAEHPGTYWYSPGWNKHHVPPGKERYDLYYKDYVERFGEDNAAYLMQTEQAWFEQYNQATYIDTGSPDSAQDQHYTRQCADWLNWNYESLIGSMDLLSRLMRGEWNEEDFLVLEPGQSMQFTGDDRIIAPHEPTPPTDE